MMRSMFSGVSGLRAHQTKMDVIGNNVANVNTIGFKSGRVTFQEVFNQTLKGAGAPDSASGRGGTNPMQVGLGIGVSSVDTLSTRGSLQRTDNPTDLSIEGDGFFICKGGSADSFKFTRAGNFGVDKLGNLVTSSGLNLYGWQDYGGTAKDDGTFQFDTEKNIEPINLYTDEYNKNKRMIGAKATTKSAFSGNLNSSYNIVSSVTNSNYQFSMPMIVYDKLGNDYKISINFWKRSVQGGSGGGTSWSWAVQPGSGPTALNASGSISFDTKGYLLSGGINNITLTPSTNAGTESFAIKLDFSKLTQYAADSSAKATFVDGYPTGNLVTFGVGADGIITGVYSNGQQQPLGMVALASFENPGGMQKTGDNMFVPTTNSGDFKKGVKAGSEGVGTLNPGTLEMSNVDLSREFTEMIVTQRGFQANSRLITASDEMLQELVNLKR